MTPLDATRLAVVLALAALVAVRAPHGHRSRRVPVARSLRGALENALLGVAFGSFLVPVAWLATGVLDRFERGAGWGSCAAGSVVVAASLVLFHRSHADLGRNWSVTLEIREGHSLVTSGVYRRLRHPMYAALLAYGAGMAVLLPNWVAGPAYLVSMAALVTLRIGPEERMMEETFGDPWRSWKARSARLVPWVW